MPASSKNTATSVAKLPDVRALLADLVKALDAKKAENLRVLSVGAHSSITDYLVLASGQANPHLRALRIEAERVLDDAGAPIAGVEAGDGSGWVVFDAYQIMVHLFLPAQRENYRLEQLWRDAEEIPVSELLAPPAPVVPAKKVVVKKAAAKKTTAAKMEPAPKKAATKKAPAKKAVTKKAAASRKTK